MSAYNIPSLLQSTCAMMSCSFRLFQNKTLGSQIRQALHVPPDFTDTLNQHPTSLKDWDQ